MQATDSVHIDLDGAWPKSALESYVDGRAWGPRLRYSATRAAIRDFYDFIGGKLAKFTLFGSGDYHHLTALWLRRLEKPVTLISFDNHPDWDIRPPHWCCGTWVNRALELPAVRKVAIWGCGNYELNWPANLFVSQKALHAQRLAVWPWTERLKESGRKRWPGMTRESWQDQFQTFARGLTGQDVYVTIDLDCLDRADSTTNWENGLFRIADIQWALKEIRSHAAIAGGDLCGAYSQPVYARWVQRMESTLDHPKRADIDAAAAITHNAHAQQILWAALTAQ